MNIKFYTKPDCLLCNDALTLLETLQTMYNFEIDIRNIHDCDDWLEKYFLHIPVIDIEGTTLLGEAIEFTQIETLIKQKQKDNIDL